jgi:hypothetical protein
MKYLKKFENFSDFDLGRFSEEDELQNPGIEEVENDEEECAPCGSEDSEDNDEYTFTSDDDEDNEEEAEYADNHRIRRWGDESIENIGNIDEKKKEKAVSYKKSGLKNPEKADLNKDKKISGYEKARGKAIQKSVQSEKEEKEEKGLTAAQKKLPEGLRKAIEAKNKKK